MVLSIPTAIDALPSVIVFPPGEAIDSTVAPATSVTSVSPKTPSVINPSPPPPSPSWAQSSGLSSKSTAKLVSVTPDLSKPETFTY